MKILALLLLALSAYADDDAAMGRHVQELLHAHQADVFACVQAANKDADGEMLVRVFVGEEHKAARVDVLKDQSGVPHLGQCIADRVRTWDLTSLGAGRGDQIVFPLAFHPENPYKIHAEAKGEGKVSPTILWSGGKASLTLLELAPSVRLAPHVHTAGEALYVVKGMLRVSQNGKSEELKEGDAVWFAAGEPHAIEAPHMAKVVLLQAFAPSGPEVAYLDHKAGGTSPSRASAKKPAWLATATKALTIPVGSIKLFLDGAGAPIALDELTADKNVPAHKHDDSDELLYFFDGKGTMTVAGKAFPVAAGDAVRIPAGSEHALTVTDKLTAVQLYAPGGPEQRFKK